MFSQSNARSRGDRCNDSLTIETMARELRVLTKVRTVAGSHAREILALPVIYNSRLKRAYGRFLCATMVVELAPWLRNDSGERSEEVEAPMAEGE